MILRGTTAPHPTAQMNALKVSLPPGKTMIDLFKEQHFNSNSPLKTIMADVEEKFGPVLPPELSVSARMPPLDEVSTYVTAMPGKVYEIEYTTASGRRAVSHIVDVSFLRAWIEHPNFYMIK